MYGAFKEYIQSGHGSMPTPKLTPEVIQAALLGFEAQKERIDQEIAALRALLPAALGKSASPSGAGTHKRRRMSAEGRARIAAAQRKRWEEAKQGKKSPATSAKPKAKRHLSAAGRKAISEAAKRRWAAQAAATK